MKRHTIFLCIVVVVFTAVNANIDWRKEEARLSKTTKQEIVDLMVGLLNDYSVEEEKKILEYGEEALEFPIEFPIEFPDQEKEVSKTSLIIFSLTVLLLALLIYNWYRLKVRSRKELEKEIQSHKETTKKLQESEEKFKTLSERSVVGIYIIQDNIFKYTNPRVLYLFGYSFKELEGMRLFDLVFKEDQPLVEDYISSTKTDEIKSHSCEFRGVTKGGKVIHLEGYFAQTIFEGQPAVLGSIIDITDRKNTEDELIRSRKLESIGILAGGIAHDFNNILAIITGYLMMIKESVEEDKGLLKIVGKLEKASTQATELAQKLITFSRGGWIFRQKTDVGDVINNAIEAYPDIKPHLKKMLIPPDLLPINGDSRQLTQVITNILQNSDEAMTDPRELTIQAANVVLDEKNNLSLFGGKYVNISITDNGKGVPRDQLQKIFDPYFTTKDDVSQKGIGLGLAISYSIIKKHNGTISVDSTLGEGTTIDLYIPCFSNTDIE